MANVKKKKENIITNNKSIALPEYVSYFDKLGKNTLYIAISLVFIIAFLVFRDFLWGYKVYLFKDIGSDSLNANLPYLMQMTKSLQMNGELSWSFHSGMGQSLFPLSLRDPFDLLIFMGGTKNIYYMLGFKEFLKILIGGLLFFLYLKELGVNNYTKIIGTLCFAFCGFMIVGSGWYIFSFEAVNMALLLYGFELLFQKNKGIIFCLGIFLLALSMPFSLYLYGLFITIYALLRYYSQANPFEIKGISLLYAKMILFGAIGIGLSGPFLLESVNQLLLSPRGSGENSYFQQLISMPMFELSSRQEFGTGMMRLFSSDIIGTGNTFRGWGNTLEAPMFYCGISSLILMPQLFVFLAKKQRIAFIAFILLWFLPVLFPYFRRAIWLFTGDYYRSYSFFVSLTLLLFASMALNKILETRKVHLATLGVTVLILYVLLMYPYFDDTKIFNEGISLFIKVFIFVNAGIIYMLSKVKNNTPVLALFLLITCVELFYFSNTSVNKRNLLTKKELSAKVGYNDYSNEAVQYLKTTDSSFYRIDKGYSSSPAMVDGLNDGMMQDYFGSSCYNGFSQNTYIRYLQSYGIIDQKNEISARWSFGVSNRVILESINSVDYLLLKENKQQPNTTGYEYMAKFGDITVMKNKFSLPLGFCYDSYIINSDFNKLGMIQKDFVSLKAFMVEDNMLPKMNAYKKFDLRDTINLQLFDYAIYDSLTRNLKKDTMIIESFAENHIKGKIEVENAKLLYLSIPYDKGWNIKLNETKIEPVIIAAGMIGIPLNIGINYVELKFEHVYFNTGIILFVLNLGVLIVVLLLFSKRNKKNTNVNTTSL